MFQWCGPKTSGVLDLAPNLAEPPASAVGQVADVESPRTELAPVLNRAAVTDRDQGGGHKFPIVQAPGDGLPGRFSALVHGWPSPSDSAIASGFRELENRALQDVADVFHGRMDVHWRMCHEHGLTVDNEMRADVTPPGPLSIAESIDTPLCSLTHGHPATSSQS